MKGCISSVQFYDTICEKYGRSLLFEEFKTLWNGILTGQKEDVAEIVNAVRRNYDLALLSNVDQWHYEYCLKNYPVLAAFEKRFTSFEEHLLKPDPEFYLSVAVKLAIEPRACLFIDDLEENIKSANEVGFRTIHFRTAEQLKKELTSMGILIQ